MQPIALLVLLMVSSDMLFGKALAAKTNVRGWAWGGPRMTKQAGVFGKAFDWEDVEHMSVAKDSVRTREHSLGWAANGMRKCLEGA